IMTMPGGNSGRRNRAAPPNPCKCWYSQGGAGVSACRILAGKSYHGRFRVRRLIFSSIPWLSLAACSREQTGHTANPPPQPSGPVGVGKVVQKTVPVEVRAIGNVMAFSTVAIKARVAGQLFKVSFQ